MTKRLLLDNGPSNLICRSESGILRLNRQVELERYIEKKYPDHSIHVSMAAAVELIRLKPTKRPFEERWFQKERDVFLSDIKPLQRSESLARLWLQLENFYKEQQLGKQFQSLITNTDFRKNGLAPHITLRIEELADEDLEKRLLLLYVANDTQIATGRKNPKSDPISSMIMLDNFLRAGILKNHSGILHSVAGTLEIAREKFYDERNPNELGLGSAKDILDCDIASSLVIGSYNKSGIVPTDVLTFETTNGILKRAMAVRAAVTNWRAFLKRKFPPGHPDRIMIQLQLGAVAFARFDENSSTLRDSGPFRLNSISEKRIPDLNFR